MSKLTLSDAKTQSFDVCILGAGAAGGAIALDLIRSGIKFLIIDRGTSDEGHLPQARSTDKITNQHTHAARHVTNRDAISGTLHAWGGRCMPYFAHEFEQTDQSGRKIWPIRYNDYAPWIRPAAEFLQVDPEFARPAPASWPNIAGINVDEGEALNPTDQAGWLCQQLDAVPVLEKAEIIQLELTDGPGQTMVKGVTVKQDGIEATLACDRIIIAIGGIETARLCLLTQERHPPAFGGPNGALGRFYMGHLTGSVANIQFTDPKSALDFGYQSDGHRSPWRRRLRLPDPEKTSAIFWVENLAATSPHNQSGELALKHVLKNPNALTQHIATMAKDPAGTLGIISAVGKRLSKTRQRPAQKLVLNRNRTYGLAYHSEHLPNRESHVALTSETDKFGRRIMEINFAYDIGTIEALIADHHRLRDAFSGSNYASLSFEDDETLADHIRSVAKDGYHQIGLTRMSSAPEDGVVDQNCEVHGVKNLFIASAAVFASSGHANPTLSVVAFALRLADHIKRTASKVAL